MGQRCRQYRAICGGDPEFVKVHPNLSYDVTLIGYRRKGIVSASALCKPDLWLFIGGAVVCLHLEERHSTPRIAKSPNPQLQPTRATSFQVIPAFSSNHVASQASHRMTTPGYTRYVMIIFFDTA
ncbi:inner membrane protease subunit 1 [Fusarium oxysporum f. sp. albedinis]|nr:inner membrane protease subunit 1 [Fusarium oxysporum f. sp. albedinis]